MKNKILTIFIVMFGMLLSTTIVYAGQVAVSHAVIANVSTGSGADVSLEVTVTNSTGNSLYNMKFESADLVLRADPGTNILTVGDLPAGASVTLPWRFHIALPEYIPEPNLNIIGSATDANGQALNLDTSSVRR